MKKTVHKTKKTRIKPHVASDQLTIKDVKKGDYNRSYGKYEAIKTSDVWGNPRMVKGSTPVDIEFEY